MDFSKLLNLYFFPPVHRGWFSKRGRIRKKARKTGNGPGGLRELIFSKNYFMNEITKNSKAWGCGTMIVPFKKEES